jgi:hypothetical protein
MRRRTVLLALALVVVTMGGARLARAAEPDDHAARLAQLSTQRDKLDGERRALEGQLAQKTHEIADLKKQRASWGRDQKLDKRLREAKDLASQLDRKADQIRTLDGTIRGERQALVKSADAELAQSPAPARRATLERWRADAQRGLAPPKRLKVADEDISPLDDPEDLDEKAATLSDSESDLRAEEERLSRRAAYYRKQARLQRAKQRAGEHDVFDEQPRRGSGGGHTEALGSAKDGAGSPPPSSPPASPTGGGFTGAEDQAAQPSDGELGGDPSVVYADVVDPDTLAAMEKAERSGDPDAKAAAAERAEKDVHDRAERLKKKRLEMQKRAAELRQR